MTARGSWERDFWLLKSPSFRCTPLMLCRWCCRLWTLCFRCFSAFFVWCRPERHFASIRCTAWPTAPNRLGFVKCAFLGCFGGFGGLCQADDLGHPNFGYSMHCEPFLSSLGSYSIPHYEYLSEQPWVAWTEDNGPPTTSPTGEYRICGGEKHSHAPQTENTWLSPSEKPRTSGLWRACVASHCLLV